MKTLYLHGSLRRFGKSFTFDVSTPLELVQALASQHRQVENHLRVGRYLLVAGPLSRKRQLTGRHLSMQLHSRHLHLYPVLEGANKGRGKMVLGLTLLGLSFVPGAASSIGQIASSAGASPAFAAQAGRLGTMLAANAGQYLMARGALDAVSPQISTPANLVEPQIVSAPASISEGIALPLIYGQVRLRNPLFIQSGLSVETEQL